MPSTDGRMFHAVFDSGVPERSVDYTTLVIFHGMMWSSKSFRKLVPLAPKYNARIIALNRRDYPGSKPFTADERAVLKRLFASASSVTPETQKEARDFMRDRARDVSDYLVDLIQREKIPLAQGTGSDAKGGIVLAGWSFASTWMSAFAAYAPTFTNPDVQLGEYVRRVVSLDGSSPFLGLAPPPAFEVPTDVPTTAEELAARVRGLHAWGAAYYDWNGPHDTSGAPKIIGSTLDNLTAEEQDDMIYNPPGLPPDGADLLLLTVGYANDVYKYQKELYFFEAKGWEHVEFRIIWCDQSMFEFRNIAQKIEEELEAVRAAGKVPRNITTVPIHGNHFIALDAPEDTMRGLLGN